MPDTRNFQFSKAEYDALMAYLSDVDEVLNTTPQLLGPSVDLKLDANLATAIRPGSQSWTIAKQFATQAGVFGASAQQQYTLTETEVRAFLTALKNASDIFQDTDNLATYEASKFSQNYPDVAGTTS
ncbi:hypothetical protein KIH74_14700 [Kineosporia sp. J2-2]|uniref:Uncharacterized protein n=1 Tax=Kineosporia corallincola TaxID=2835133 RepID=A0ABS5TGH0_9ACTN|nr:hypothetical protein [Kineosporia corallincola]MBT0770187.1 hypothetical protein [Kineosporia corallincola]